MQPTLESKNFTILVQSQRAKIDAQLTQRLSDFISKTRRTLDCAIYDLRDETVLAALAALPANGRRLRIVRDGGKTRSGKAGADPKHKGMEELIAKYRLTRLVQVIPEQGGHFMHNKFLIRDGSTVWTGSANFTPGGLQLQDNNCLIVRSAALAARYQSVFDSLWKTKKVDAAHSSAAAQIDGIAIRAWFEPGSDAIHVEDLLLPYLKRATSVRLLAFEITDAGILAVLSLFEPQGKDIRGILDGFEYSKALDKIVAKHPNLYWFRNDPRFARAPSHPFRKNGEQDFMHNKTFVLDGQTVITGSYNFSDHAELNEENLLVIDSRQVARFYLSYFDALFKQYRQ